MVSAVALATTINRQLAYDIQHHACQMKEKREEVAHLQEEVLRLKVEKSSQSVEVFQLDELRDTISRLQSRIKDLETEKTATSYELEKEAQKVQRALASLRDAHLLVDRHLTNANKNREEAERHATRCDQLTSQLTSVRETLESQSQTWKSSSEKWTLREKELESEIQQQHEHLQIIETTRTQLEATRQQLTKETRELTQQLVTAKAKLEVPRLDVGIQAGYCAGVYKDTAVQVKPEVKSFLIQTDRPELVHSNTQTDCFQTAAAGVQTDHGSTTSSAVQTSLHVILHRYTQTASLGIAHAAVQASPTTHDVNVCTFKSGQSHFCSSHPSADSESHSKRSTDTAEYGHRTSTKFSVVKCEMHEEAERNVQERLVKGVAVAPGDPWTSGDGQHDQSSHYSEHQTPGANKRKYIAGHKTTVQCVNVKRARSGRISPYCFNAASNNNRKQISKPKSTGKTQLNANLSKTATGCRVDNDADTLRSTCVLPSAEIKEEPRDSTEPSMQETDGIGQFERPYYCMEDHLTKDAGTRCKNIGNGQMVSKTTYSREAAESQAVDEGSGCGTGDLQGNLAHFISGETIENSELEVSEQIQEEPSAGNFLENCIPAANIGPFFHETHEKDRKKVTVPPLLQQLRRWALDYKTGVTERSPLSMACKSDTMEKAKRVAHSLKLAKPVGRALPSTARTHSSRDKPSSSASLPVQSTPARLSTVHSSLTKPFHNGLPVAVTSQGSCLQEPQGVPSVPWHSVVTSTPTNANNKPAVTTASTSKFSVEIREDMLSGDQIISLEPQASTDTESYSVTNPRETEASIDVTYNNGAGINTGPLKAYKELALALTTNRKFLMSEKVLRKQPEKTQTSSATSATDTNCAENLPQQAPFAQWQTGPNDNKTLGPHTLKRQNVDQSSSWGNVDKRQGQRPKIKARSPAPFFPSDSREDHRAPIDATLPKAKLKGILKGPKTAKTKSGKSKSVTFPEKLETYRQAKDFPTSRLFLSVIGQRTIAHSVHIKADEVKLVTKSKTCMSESLVNKNVVTTTTATTAITTSIINNIIIHPETSTTVASASKLASGDEYEGVAGEAGGQCGSIEVRGQCGDEEIRQPETQGCLSVPDTPTLELPDDHDDNGEDNDVRCLEAQHQLQTVTESPDISQSEPTGISDGPA